MKKTIRTAEDTLKAAAIVDAFDLKRVQMVDCAVSQRLREDRLPEHLKCNVDYECEHFADKKTIVVDLLCSLNAYYDEAESGEAPLALKCTFRAHYVSESSAEVADDQLAAFGKATATFNVWPYWREFVQTMTSRMGLPPLTLPFFRLGIAEPVEPEEPDA